MRATSGVQAPSSLPTVLHRHRWWLVALLAAGTWFAGVASADAAPAYPFERTFEQADESEITLVRWGDEFVNGWETPAGHTVVKDEGSGNWEYATRGRDGRLHASGKAVGADGAPAASEGARPSRSVYEAEKSQFHAANSTSGTSSASSSASSSSAAPPAWAGSDTDVLFLAVEFADTPCSFTVTQHQSNMFGGAASGPGDLDDYYREISYGALEIDGQVVGDNADGCISLVDNHAVYDTGSKNAADVVNEAVAAADGYVDFSQFDNDGDGTVDAMGIIYAGGGPHDGCETDNGDDGSDDDNLWPHSGGTGGTATADGVSVNPYIINSEVTFAIGGSGCNVIQTVGLFAHEFGHSLGLPDLYDTDGSSDGVGPWSTMASQYRSTVNLADTPPHFDPWSKAWLGWVSPTDHSGFEGNGPIQQVETTGEVYQLGTNPNGFERGGTGEYWLIENRQLVGFDAQLPGCGLAIWHIEESMTHNQNEGHTTGSHRLVDIEEADGLDELDDADDGAGADAGDVYPGTSGNRLFNDVSYPTANYYDGSPSGFRVADISDCDAVMTANFGNPFADLEVNKTTNHAAVKAGETLTYTIHVTNHGPATASNVTVTDTLPDDVTYQVGPSYCSESSGVVTCDLGQMLSGESTSFFLQVVVDEDAVVDSGGSAYLTNTVEVTADQADDDLTNNEDTADTLVTDEADLRVTKTCKPDGEADAGSEAFCDLTVHNFGPSTARDVEVIDEIVSDTAFTITGSSFDCNAVATTDGYDVTCQYGDVDPGQSVTRTVRFSADEGGDVNDTARVTSPTPDPNGGNDIATGHVTFRPVADLSLTKTDSPDPVVAGEQLTYTLTATNNGPSTAENVLVKDVLPSQVSIVSVTPSAPGNCSAGVPGDAALPTGCQFGSLADGASVSVEIVVLVDPAATGILTNDGWVSSDAHDPDNSDSVASSSTTVEAVADLGVVKVSSPDPVVAGEVMQHTITVTNHGPSVARDVHLEDALPDGTSFLGVTVEDASAECALVDVPPDTVMCDLPDLGPGQSLIVYIDVEVHADVLEGETLTNTATVTTSATDPNAGNDSDDATVGVIAVADLAVDKEGGFDAANSSNTVRYTITADNHGPSDAQDVVIVDTLPSITTGGGQEKVAFVHATAGCTYDEPSHTVTCDVGTLADGGTYVAEIYINVSGNADLTNEVDISSSTTDPVMGNNHDTHTIKLKGGSNKGGGPKGPK